MVGYLNTQPFQWAFNNISDKYLDIKLGSPAECAEMLEKDEVDLALIPVGAMDDPSLYTVHTDYCIGCDGLVRTVVLFSDSELPLWETVYLDSHSRTSQLLVKILLKEYFGMTPEYRVENIKDVRIREREAVLMIGDKVFENENTFRYRYDLGDLWKEKTGLPFIFALWVSKNNTPIHPAHLRKINRAFAGIIDQLDSSLQERVAIINGVDLNMYFRKNISYKLDKAKKMGLELFFRKAKPYLPKRSRVSFSDLRP